LSQPYRHIRDLHSFPTRRSSDLEEKEDQLAGVVDHLDGGFDPAGEDSDELLDLDGKALLAAIADADESAPDEEIPGQLLRPSQRSEEHTSELQSRFDLVCRLLLE